MKLILNADTDDYFEDHLLTYNQAEDKEDLHVPVSEIPLQKIVIKSC